MSDPRPNPWKDLPEPDSVEKIPPMHPASVKAHESFLRLLKNAVGIYETWLNERRR